MKLRDICKYRKEKIELKKIKKEQYISTDNMLPNFSGIGEIKSFPNVEKVNKCYKNDILISNIRPYFKKMIISDIESGCSPDILVIETISKDVNPKFLYYRLMSDDFFDYVILTSKGTKMPRGDKDAIMNFELILPNIRIQNKIVEILETIDKNIKLNNQINNNLHEYAQELFKEWFIKFNYPASNKKKKNSELGLIPDDWKVGYFGDNILSKIIKSGVKKFNDEKKYVATADVSNSSINRFTMVKYDDKPSRANMTPIENSIWFAKMEGSKKNILVTNYTRELLNNYIFSTGFMGIECINNSINYLWELINSDSFVLEKDALSTGTLMAGISNSTITNYKYLIPTDEVINKFNKIINVINNKIYNNQIQNKRLEQLRDTLLPKLMNGEIDLDNIEI